MRTSLLSGLVALQACTTATAITVALTPPSSPPASPAEPRSVALITKAPSRSMATTTSTSGRPVTAALRPPIPAARRTPPARRPIVRRVVTSHVTVTTPRQRLDAAVARIPGYGTSPVTWLLQANDGHWGTADWYRDVIWISPRVPSGRVYDVVVHEWSHVKSVRDYGGDVNLAVSEMNRYFGGSGLIGAERAADCMARLDGARWTHYTSCADSRWRAGAAQLLAGRRL